VQNLSAVWLTTLGKRSEEPLLEWITERVKPPESVIRYLLASDSPNLFPAMRSVYRANERYGWVALRIAQLGCTDVMEDIAAAIDAGGGGGGDELRALCHVGDAGYAKLREVFSDTSPKLFYRRFAAGELLAEYKQVDVFDDMSVILAELVQQRHFFGGAGWRWRDYTVRAAKALAELDPERARTPLNEALSNLEDLIGSPNKPDIHSAVKKIIENMHD